MRVPKLPWFVCLGLVASSLSVAAIFWAIESFRSFKCRRQAVEVAYQISELSWPLLDCIAEAQTFPEHGSDADPAQYDVCKQLLEKIVTEVDTEQIRFRANPDWQIFVSASVPGGREDGVAFAAEFNHNSCAGADDYFVAIYTASGRVLEARSMDVNEVPAWLLMPKR